MLFFHLFLILLILLCFYNFYWKRRNLPPGPIPLPIVGNLLSFYGNPKFWEKFLDWRSKYGDVYTYWLGERPIVGINDYRLMVETFAKDGASYEGRPDEQECLENFLFPSTLSMIDGPKWRDHRRFALYHMRNFGMGRNIMQEKILEEVSYLIKNIRYEIANQVDEIDVAKHLEIAVGSIINNLLFGYRWDKTNASEFYRLKHTVDKVMTLFLDPTMLIMRQKYSFFSKLPYFRRFAKEAKQTQTSLKGFYEKQVQDFRQKLDLNSFEEPTNLVEALLKEQAKNEANGEVDHFYTNDDIIGMINVMFIAGQDTTSTTLVWGMIFLILFPEVQEKINQEISRDVGRDRIVKLEDRPLLHYTNAACQEIQRCASIIPMNLLHRTMKDVTINGYHIPKDTIIVPQVGVTLNDERYFKNPEEFNPERFLNEEGEFMKREEICTFSMGKRVCLGESLARMEIFLFVANLVQFFKFSSVPGKPPSMKRQVGLTAPPFPFVCKVEESF